MGASFYTLFLLFSTTVTAFPLTTWPSNILQRPVLPARIPTVGESAAMARRMLRLEGIGTLSTIYKTTPKTADVEGSPLGLMDYFADCEPATGNPTLLGLTVSSSFRNAAAGSNMTLSVRWHPQLSKAYSAMEMPRFALIGEAEQIQMDNDESKQIASCYTKKHPDSRWWLPGNKIHESFWVRLNVKEVYWIGGFGDRAYIGFIPLDVWKGVTEDEISNAKLLGEEPSIFRSKVGDI